MANPLVPRSHYVSFTTGAINAWDATSIAPKEVTSSNITDFDGYGIFVDDRSESSILSGTNPKLFSREEAIEWYYKTTGIRYDGTTYRFPVQGFDDRKHEWVESQLVNNDSEKFRNLTLQGGIELDEDYFVGVSPSFAYCPNISGSKKYLFEYYFQEITDWGQDPYGVGEYAGIGSVNFSRVWSEVTLGTNDVNQQTATSTVTSGEYSDDFSLTLADSGYTTRVRRSVLSTDPDLLDVSSNGDFYIPAYGSYAGTYASYSEYENARDEFINSVDSVGSIENDSPIIVPGMQRRVRSFNGVTYYQYYHPIGDWMGGGPEHKLVDN